MKTPAKALLLLSFSSLFSLLPAKAGDWYQWRGPERNGISQETGWSTNWPDGGPKQLWKTNVGLGFASVTVSSGRAYTTGNNGSDTDTIYCFDAVTGAEIWKHSFPCPLDPHWHQGGTTATPTVDGDRVYSVSKKGHFFCLDAAKGTVIWAKNLTNDYGFELAEWGIASSPLVLREEVYLNVGSAGTAFNKKTGDLIWTSDKKDNGYANILPFKSGNDQLLAIFSFRTMEVVKMDGTKVWSYPWKNSSSINAGDPIVADGKMYFSSGYGKGCTLLDISKEKPEAVWENKNICNKFDVPILWNGYIYCTDETKKGQLKCLDWNTGELKWSEPSMGQGGIAMADGKLIILSEKGELVIAPATPDGFKPIARAQVLTGPCWPTPTLANGRIYCRSNKGDVVCLDVSGK
jgi:outer membrane protein assembly factor BamB